MMEVKKSESSLLMEYSISTISPSSVSDTPKKRNLSFSFNFDFDNVNSDNSADSDTAALQIDVSKVDNYDRSSKHKREADEEASVLNEMEEEIERQLDAKAAKTNLTATNVKNILKHVITNEHVMAMVQKRLHDNDEDIVFEPKLTRAKAKELAAIQGRVPWPITSVKKASSGVQVLIEEELAEDSSDEEYHPDHDKQSDDEREAEIPKSDIDSLLSTPVNAHGLLCREHSKLSDVQYDPEGIFKIPEIPHVPTEEESIGQRTRSKLCLSETSLEQIEQAFVPPDITTDMYDWDREVDDDWNNFLKEFTQPLTQYHVNEDDPEADPEYNILEDEETDLLDKEELRADKAVKVTRKELNNLIAELFEFTDTYSKQEQEVSKKKKPSDNLSLSVENNSLNCSMVDLLPVLAEPELPKLVNPEQQLLLATQFRQHVQLMAQHFVMTFMHPELNQHSKVCKENLNSLKYLSNGVNSVFNTENLADALKLVSDWENEFLDPKFSADYKRFVTEEQNTRHRANNGNNEIQNFHPKLKELLYNSKALIYPQLLPHVPFNKSVQAPYLKSEENLLALGLEQFLPFVSSRPRMFWSRKVLLMDALQLVIQYLLPCRELRPLFYHVQKRRYAKDPNPIQHYFKKGCAPKTIHYITPECNPTAPKDQPISHLPHIWQKYCKIELGINNPVKHKPISNSCNVLLKNLCTVSDKYRMCVVPDNHPLRNPVVNILPKILPANLNIKSTQCNVNEAHCSTENSKGTTTQECPPNDKSTKTVKLLPKKSSELLQQIQLRETTPRLAKTRSAQNMKLMTQVSGPKNTSSNNATKSREKGDTKKTVPNSCPLAKVDNEDEIAELMLASTTIKKDALSRKKAKQARELENIKRLLEAENPLQEEEREAKFAASYFQKLHLTLESSNPEVLRAVIKLYLEYNEKLDSINQMENESCLSSESHMEHTGEIKQKDVISKDSLAVSLYQSICEKFHDYPEMCTDFLLFLKPHQAAMIDKSIEYMMLQKMNEFVNVAQIYFAKQPSRLARMMQAITQLSSNPYVTLENVQNLMTPIFKGHPLVMDLFLQTLPCGKPPESLFASCMYENLTCPLGPYDKTKVYTEDAPELYETIDLPVLTPQDDPYGGDNCKCNCHNTDASHVKTNTEHCVSCGMRFLNGRIYLHTPDGLRPAKITFPGAEEERLENISRVSLKTSDKLIPTAGSRQRRKSSKNESSPEDSYQKQSSVKNSPTKDSDDPEKIMSKSKRGSKSPPKASESRKSLKRPAVIENIASSSKKMRPTKRERKAERKGVNQKDVSISEDIKLIEGSSVDSGGSYLSNDPLDIKMNIDSSPICQNAESNLSMEEHGHILTFNKRKENINTETANTFHVQTDKESRKSMSLNEKPWTRQEDMILLRAIKEEYSEHSFLQVSAKLGDRTVIQVKERCQILLSLLQKRT